MKKEDLIAHVEESIRREESATTVYLGHLKALVLRSGLSDSKMAKMRSTIKYLINSNTEHKQYMEDLLKKIKEDAADAY